MKIHRLVHNNNNNKLPTFILGVSTFIIVVQRYIYIWKISRKTPKKVKVANKNY